MEIRLCISNLLKQALILPDNTLILFHFLGVNRAVTFDA